ncbi:dsDNA nuclease domain-containing protein [Lysobacter capsici]|uniref:dsDNA nuclease domain-containing protein n=1 Tax=Lysobacter capsici TaxID=435897 RepID=UPI00287B7DAB|nr:dsDNA nuclease domain-containing protein [Lysobacter capsici]WND81120.1 dsDNA nuclease domain-containing protein [Lysobacter capsici]WND86316.1 dsDNA nuclease domain-containing protein [Lysobacter capsici]
MNRIVETTETEASLPTLPSIHDAKPLEEGGPTARKGFNYQDEIAVSLLLDMLESEEISCVQCETNDDVILVWGSGEHAIVEHVQVKSNTSNSTWTAANLTYKKNGKAGTSIYETSLSRDSFKEVSRFRIVTLRHVDSDLTPLTFERGKPGREPDHPKIKSLVARLEERCPDAESVKKNGAQYWVDNCHWDVRESEAALARHNLLRIIQLSVKAGFPLLPESAGVVLVELRKRVKVAGDAKWEPDRDLKIIPRKDLLDWWDGRLVEITDGATVVSGGKLIDKMTEAEVSQPVIRLAVEMRRLYAAEARAPRYMEPNAVEAMQWRVKSKIASLQSKHDAGELDDLNDAQFHDLCLSSVDGLSNSLVSGIDETAFLKGCMYDIADRCLLRFKREKA